MKTCLLLFTALTVCSARSSQNESATAGQAAASPSVGGVAVQQTYPGMPWLDYSKLPWARPPSSERANLEAVLTNLKDDLGSVLSGLSTLTNSPLNASQTNANGQVVELAAKYFDDLEAKNFSTMLGQDVSANRAQDLSANLSRDLSVGCGQLLSTSVAAPTAPPWSIWGNGPHAIVVGTPAGDMVLPTFPPRTAWGNGPGVVITTPGGAVFSMVPAEAQTLATKNLLADSAAVRDLNDKLLAVQDEVERLDTLVKNAATLRELTPAPNRPGTPPAYQPYLSPTGR